MSPSKSPVNSAFLLSSKRRRRSDSCRYRFWKGNELCRVFVCRSALPSADLTGELGCLARLLSVISTRVDIIACSGDPVGLIQTLNQSSFFNRGIQTCFRFDSLDLPTPDAQAELFCVREDWLLLRPTSPDCLLLGILACRTMGPQVNQPQRSK